jgi:hypothetical protein
MIKGQCLEYLVWGSSPAITAGERTFHINISGADATG